MKKTLKIIGFILLGLVALVLLLGLIAPREFTTERSIVIGAPPAAVFNAVNDLAEWESWSPWKEMDPSMRVTLGERTVGEGAFYTWEGEQTGSGKLSILLSRPNERIENELVFDGMGASRVFWTFAEVDDSTGVTWGFTTEVPFPFNAFFWLQGMGALNRDFERGLVLLKEKVEAEAANPSAYEVRVEELPDRYFVGVRQMVKMEEIQSFYAENLGKVMQALTSKGVEPAGMPCGLYFSWDEATGQTDMAAAIPVAGEVNLDGMDFAAIRLPAGQSLLVNYYGDYHRIEDAHLAIDQYVLANNLKTGVPIVEEYVTDPGQEPDPAKWLTRVFYPLEK